MGYICPQGYVFTSHALHKQNTDLLRFMHVEEWDYS